MNWRTVLLPLAAAALAWAAWVLAPLLLDPIGLGEFLFVGRCVLIAGVLTIAEIIFHGVPP